MALKVDVAMRMGSAKVKLVQEQQLNKENDNVENNNKENNNKENDNEGHSLCEAGFAIMDEVNDQAKGGHPCLYQHQEATEEELNEHELFL
ncbi:uncharacterized protein ACA1_124470 [Acanthamoeba castellanii str. Neff]|uniref:Uncharacterized protein n=1 Tax=Acanthamoeba castellanii (strain ATCC 30010 / Neff) TaxID=1257118 RepID=L8H5Q9_ACACF|nr:uncharacterized protein ACA1_124470 [Acanthamoeba castellanii str. Neff]ELR19806.1 hypothetical protein ACA1_124470 [Acanthamoeba castellanii str. Neff]